MIVTWRLDLVPATPDLTRAALAGYAGLGSRLAAIVPATWPPEFFNREALEFTLARLEEGPAQAGWWLHFVILRDAEAGGRVLVGSGGYKGPPSPDGTVEAGYSIVREYRRCGLATEALGGLVARAFGVPAVRRVIAETLPELEGSIGVLAKSGFSPAGEGSEPGVIRFDLSRADYEMGPAPHARTPPTVA